MTRVAIKPENEQSWKQMRVFDVTSTESSALFGLSPYATAFELWHRKRDGVIVEIEGNERMDWGTDLQDSIALSLARRYGVQVERIVDYMRIPEARMGSSFDFLVHGIALPERGRVPSDLIEMFEKHGPGILEIKNVDRSVFMDKWVKRLSDEERALGNKPEIEPPGHIDIQVQHQMHVAGVAWAAIGVLVGGNTGRLVIRMRDEEVGNALEQRIRQFWSSIEAGEAPSPLFPGDAAFVASLYKTSTDRVFDGRGNEKLNDILIDYADASAREKLAKEDKDVAKAKALMIIGDAERAYTDRFTVSAKEVGPTIVPSFERKAYRGWRITPKKGIS